uniref:Thioesterase domain-containing protein n=1 Tax=Pyrodinium bahamense TaxID=73915 RepID=A0A7S0ARE0_9DINO
MPAIWEIVGGADKGGILVREGQALGSPATKDRLSTGATVEELELAGDRLHYKLVEGTGPAEGWISIKISGKDLAVPKEAEEEIGGPGDAGPVEVDEELKGKVAAEHAKMKEKFNDYCPKYKVFKYPVADCKLRVLCFHNAGSAETNYTGLKTPFTDWAKETGKVEIVAFDFPGRQKLLKAEKHTSTATLAPELLAVVYDKLTDGIPYIVWAHSVGTWVCFEFLMAARKIGVPMPLAGFFMAFPAPHMPVAQRPWNRSKRLSEEQMKEELTNWDRAHFTGAGKVVFDEPAWKDTYLPLMRADFQLFDEYKFRHTGAPKFEFPIHAWHFSDEHYNKVEMIAMWRDWTSGTFDHTTMDGMGHLTCFYKPDLKKAYFTKVVDLIKSYSGL